VLDRVVVARAFARFDARPLDRQPVIGQAVFGVQREVFRVAHREPVAVTGTGDDSSFLEREPVARGRRALRLRRRRTGAPQEVVRKGGHEDAS
jgi:hypothetical protein